MKCIALVSAPLALAGCALIEPSARFHASATPGTSAEVVYACAETTIRALKVQRGTWRDVVTTRDLTRGVFETAQFRKANIEGIRVQIKYQSATGDALIKVKASGPYFADLGADQAAEQLASGMVECL